MEVRTQVELGSRNDEGTVGPAWDPGRPAKGSFGSPESEDRREQSGLNRDLSSCPPRLKCHPLKRARIPSPPSASRGSPGHFGGSLCKQKKLLWKLKCGYLCSGTINISDRAAVIRRLHGEADVCQSSYRGSEE